VTPLLIGFHGYCMVKVATRGEGFTRLASTQLVRAEYAKKLGMTPTGVITHPKQLGYKEPNQGIKLVRWTPEAQI
jgi:hypothetical protein